MVVTVVDSAGGLWPEDARYILAYWGSWGGTWNGRRYPDNVALAMASRPKAWVIQIAVLPPGKGVVVQGYDCEPGALTVAEACGCANHDVVIGRHPFIYAAEAAWEEIDATLERDYAPSVGKVDRWLAQPDGVPIIPPGYVAKQYSWPNSHPVAAGQGYDVSVLRSTASCLRKGDI